MDFFWLYAFDIVVGSQNIKNSFREHIFPIRTKYVETNHSVCGGLEQFSKKMPLSRSFAPPHCPPQKIIIVIITITMTVIS